MIEFEATYIGRHKVCVNGCIIPGTRYELRFKTIGHCIYVNFDFPEQMPGYSPTAEISYFTLKSFLKEWQLD